jgi:hypothetical protein
VGARCNRRIRWVSATCLAWIGVGALPLVVLEIRKGLRRHAQRHDPQLET